MEKFDFYCWCDGACEPDNPGGHLGMGSLIKDSDKKIEFANSAYRAPHENNTNNVAEYGSLYFLLKYFIDSKLTDKKIIVYGDSKLVISQMSGKWKIKESEAKYLAGAKLCREMVKQFSDIKFEWIPRDKNDECDRLSKKCLEQRGIFETKRR